MLEFIKQLKSHDWLHAFADESKMKKGRTHMQEIRNAIGWINSNMDNANAPSQFKRNYPKGLKKYSNSPGWINKILKQKPLTFDGEVG